MSRAGWFEHRFVEYVPATPSPGVLYVSLEYTTAVHLCACGCGQKVVTPLAPDRWSLTFNGRSVTLQPSIGNWGFPCESHYWIRNDRVQWAERWDTGWVQRARAVDLLHSNTRTPDDRTQTRPLGGWLRRLLGRD